MNQEKPLTPEQEEIAKALKEIEGMPPEPSEVPPEAEVPVYDIPEEHQNTTPEQALKELEEAEAKKATN